MSITYNTGATANADFASSVNITIPSGVLVNDVMLMSFEVFSETATAPTVSFSGAGGTWTLAPVTTGSNPEKSSSGSIYSYGYAYRRVATSGDPGATLTVSVTGASGGPWLDVAIASYTGASTSSPVDVAGGAEGNGPSLTCPSETTGVANDWAVYLGSGAPGVGGTWTAPSGTTVRQQIVDGSGIGAIIADSNGSVGGAGTSIGGGTFTQNGNSGWIQAFTIGLAPASAGSPAPFTPPRAARGRPAAARGSGKGSPGAEYAAFPSAFSPPHKSAKGASATRRGMSASSPGARYIHVIPPGPSPFTLPAGPAKGRSIARPGTWSAEPGAPYFHVSAFVLPARPSKGSQIAQRGRSASSAGARYVDFPSAFVLPGKAAKGRAIAQRGRSTGSAGAKYVHALTVSPFYALRKAAKGRSITRAGRSSAGSATGRGAPVVPRQLIISLASMAGTDDYGNSFPQGMLATAGVIEGPTFIGEDFIINSAGAFFYNGEPAAGKLILSISASTTAYTDSFGNHCVPLTGWYDNTGGFVTQIGAGFVTFGTGSLSAGWTGNSSIQNDSSGNLYLEALGSIYANGNLIS